MHIHELHFRNEIASQFICSHCQSHSALTELVTFWGEYKKKLSKFSAFDMILVACKSCGQLHFFDEYFLPEIKYIKPSEKIT